MKKHIILSIFCMYILAATHPLSAAPVPVSVDDSTGAVVTPTAFDPLFSPDIDTFAELDALVADKTLLNAEDDAVVDATWSFAEIKPVPGFGLDPDKPLTIGDTGGGGASLNLVATHNGFASFLTNTPGQVFINGTAGTMLNGEISITNLDTTITRSAPGVIAVEGVDLLTEVAAADITDATATGIAAITATDAAALRDAAGAAAADDIYWEAAMPLDWQLPMGSDVWTDTATTGSATVTTNNNNRVELRTNATAESTAYAAHTRILFTSIDQIGNQQVFDWAKEFWVSGLVSMGQGSMNGIRRISIGKFPAAAMGDLATSGIQLIFTGHSSTSATLVLQVHDGTTLTNESSVLVNASGYAAIPFIIHNHGDGNVDIYYDDDVFTRTVTVSSSAGPDTISAVSSGNHTLRIEVDNASDASSTRLDLYRAKIVVKP